MQTGSSLSSTQSMARSSSCGIRSYAIPATCNPRRSPEPDMVDLPHGIRIALKRIADELQNMPRECIVDRHELLLWKNRIARRIMGVQQTKVPAERPGWNTPTPAPARPSPATALEAADAVFGTKSASAARKPPVRTVTSRKGRSVKVETRSSARQLSLFGASP